MAYRDAAHDDLSRCAVDNGEYVRSGGAWTLAWAVLDTPQAVGSGYSLSDFWAERNEHTKVVSGYFRTTRTTTPGNGTAVLTLPPGWRPAKQSEEPLLASGGSGGVQVHMNQIATDGRCLWWFSTVPASGSALIQSSSFEFRIP